MPTHRQQTPLSFEIWSGPGVCILAIDALDHPEEGIAFLSGEDVLYAVGGRVYALQALSAQTRALIQLGQSGIVEFGPEGPFRETPIELR